MDQHRVPVHDPAAIFWQLASYFLPEAIGEIWVRAEAVVVQIINGRRCTQIVRRTTPAAPEIAQDAGVRRMCEIGSGFHSQFVHLNPITRFAATSRVAIPSVRE